MSDSSPSSPSTPQRQAMQGPLRGDEERTADSTGAGLPEQQETAVEATTTINHVVPDLPRTPPPTGRGPDQISQHNLHLPGPTQSSPKSTSDGRASHKRPHPKERIRNGVEHRDASGQSSDEESDDSASSMVVNVPDDSPPRPRGSPPGQFSPREASRRNSFDGIGGGIDPQ